MNPARGLSAIRSILRQAKLDLNFTRDAVLDPRITFSRTSNATRVNAQGLIEYAPHNLLTNSENFDNAVWVKANATVTANAVTAPDGTTTADKLVENTAAVVPHGLAVDTSSLSSTTQYTFSVYAKAGERTWVRLGLVDNLGTDGGRAWFDLSTGVVGTVEINGAGSNINATINSIGAGWYRCRLTIQMNNGKTTLQSQVRLATANNVLSYTGDGTSGIYIWGAQLNIGSLQPYYTTSVKNLLGYSQNFENAAWTKSNSSVLTNLLTYSQEFDNAAWSKAAVAITANQRISPDGTLSMDTITLTGGAGYLQQTATTTSTVAYNLSIFVYAASNKTKIIAHNGATDICAVTWSSISANTNTVSGTAANITSKLVGNNIYILSFSFIASSTTTNIRLQCLDSVGNPAIGATGDFWGAQLVQGTKPEEYTVTTSAPAPIQVMGPLDFLGAEKLVEDTANAQHHIRQAYTTTNQLLTVSVYAKAAERSRIFIQLSNNTTGAAGAQFDLSNGVASMPSNGGDFTGATASIINVGDGWYRCSLTTLKGSTNNAAWPYITIVNSSGSVSYTGDGTSGIYIFGAQVSDSASLDPYVYNFGAAPTSTAYYGPRFDYDPVTLAPKGLLIEEQRTNLLTYSSEFDNAVWVVSGGVVAPNSTISPSGEITADTLTENVGSTDPRLAINYPFAVGANYALSVYAKVKPGSSSRYLMLVFNSGYATPCGVNFDLSIGTVGTSREATGYITQLANGWYRCSMVPTSNATGGGSLRIRMAAVNTAGNIAVPTSYTGDGTSGIYIWGAQLEAGSFPTSYIPTTASSVTRAADTASMTGTNFSSWYNQSEGTFVTSSIGSSTAGIIVSANNSTISERVQVSYGSSSGGNINLTVTDGGVLQAQPLIGSITPTNLNKTAATYKLDDFALSVNGVTPAVATVGTIPTPDRLTIGMLGSGSIQINGHIQSFKYYPRRLANTYLQRLTR